ncbi:uncharacterized protein [Littorina saxatilis]|uniref:Ig-like domain-containing protein n=1 Tax=Littorina saxatilis TaxID=31220 RepID=A0AAN9BM80_9CAEN
MAVLKEALLPCCVWLMLLFVRCSALTLSPCVNDGNVRVAEVERGKTSSFTCRDFPAANTVQWIFLGEDGRLEFSAGKCPPIPDSCQVGVVSPTFTASRSATESVMTVDPSQREYLVREGTLRCGNSTGTDNTCRMDLTTPAVVSACSVKFERVGTDWQTTGRCDISSAAYSSRGRYICRWYRQKVSSAKEQIKQAGYTPSSRVCNFTEALPTAVGVYTYSVTVNPGDVSMEASFTGEHPSAPTMTGCSADDYIAENTAVSCTCRTVNVGQPAGRLVWFRGVDSVKFGNYGDDTLTVSHTLTRADHDVTQFRCVVDWATNVQGESRTFKVGYKPERLSFKLGSGSQTEVTVKENNTVLLTCEADSRPVADMTVVRQGGLEVNSSQSPLTFPLTASCTDTGTYLCSASNVIGQADTSVSAKLYVECKPRIALTEPALEVNYTNQLTGLDFDVMAYPAPTSFSSFKYLGPDGTDPASETINITLTITCQLKPGALYISTCTLTVHIMTSPAAAGFYTVTLFNTEGSLT